MKRNILISAVLHLVLGGMMALSVVFVVDRAMMVAPDRIEITEISLDDVTVTGVETKLINTTTVPPVVDPVNKDSENISMAAVNPDPQTDTPPETTQLDVPMDNPAKNQPAVVPEPDIKPVAQLPKKKTVVRVNREKLTRTMTVSVTDALRVALTRCWVIDTAYPGIGDIRAVAHLTMARNGRVLRLRFDSEPRAQTDAAFGYVLDTIRDAITACQPFKMLPPNEFSTWEHIELTFYPTSGKIM